MDAGRQAVIGHLLAPDPEVAGHLVARVAKLSRAEQVLRITDSPVARVGELPRPGGGPILTWRELADSGMPELGEWDLTRGDVELF